MQTAHLSADHASLPTAPSAGLAGDELPVISVVVLCRNEKDFIAACLDSLLATDYPSHRLEILISDGLSQDGTRAIVGSYARRYPNVRLIDNPGKIPAAAANQGIKSAKGNLIVIAGAHAFYPPDYISKCAAYSLRYPEADNIGGVRLTAARRETVLGKSIAYVSSHPLGAGPAAYHRTRAASPSWVDSVWGGCYRKEVFERLGLYDETLVVGEDREFNRRLRSAGGKILQVPEIQCTYYARSSFRDFCSWAFRMGFWPFYSGRLIRKSMLSLRNFAPLVLLVALALLLSVSLWSGTARLIFLASLAACAIGAIVTSARLAIGERDPRYLAVSPAVFACTHVLYAAGSLYGIFKPVFRTNLPVATESPTANRPGGKGL